MTKFKTFTLSALLFTSIAQASTYVIVDRGIHHVGWWNDVSTVPLMTKWRLDKIDYTIQGTERMIIQKVVYFQGQLPEMIATVYEAKRYHEPTGDPTDLWISMNGWTIFRNGWRRDGSWISHTNFWQSLDGQPLLEKSSVPANVGRYEQRWGKVKIIVHQHGSLRFVNRTEMIAEYWLFYYPLGPLQNGIVVTNRVGPLSTKVWSMKLGEHDWLRGADRAGPFFRDPLSEW